MIKEDLLPLQLANLAGPSIETRIRSTVVNIYVTQPSLVTNRTVAGVATGEVEDTCVAHGQVKLRQGVSTSPSIQAWMKFTTVVFTYLKGGRRCMGEVGI